MKKIKITEDQAKRTKILNEDANPLAKFELYCKGMVDRLNKVYSKMINISIAELLEKKVDIVAITKEVDNIENAVHEGNRLAYKFIETLPESDLDMRIDRATDSVTNKATALQLMLNVLERLQTISEEHNLLKDFHDVKPLDITSLQS